MKERNSLGACEGTAYHGWRLLGLALSYSAPSVWVSGFLPLHCSYSTNRHFAGFGTTRSRRLTSPCSELCFSSIGGGNSNGRPPSGGGRGKGDGVWDDFLNLNEESQNLQRAREYMSDNSVPLSYEHSHDDDEVDLLDDVPDDVSKKAMATSALVRPASSNDTFLGAPSAEALVDNPYVRVVAKLSPSDMIAKFAQTAHPRVRDAVRTTILGLIGGLPKLAFETKTVTTGQRLASLMFQLQMTGYMMKNADYRLSLQESLGVSYQSSNNNLLLSGSQDHQHDHRFDNDDDHADLLKGKVKGKLRIRYGGSTPASSSFEKVQGDHRSSSENIEDFDINDDLAAAAAAGGGGGGGNGIEMEVDAAAYMAELRSEVSKLRDELSTKRKAQDELLRKDLLLFIRTLPEQELRSLTNTMSPDVLVAMKGLVNAVMSGIGEGQIGPDTVTEQSGEAMAQLCMWQLAIGYNLRTMEVREEMRKSLTGGGGMDSPGGVDLSTPGALE